MQQREGSSARKPHSSSRSKPLNSIALAKDDENAVDIPHTQHIDKMLLCHVVLLVDIPLERSKDVLFVHQPLATPSLHVDHGLVGDACFVRRGIALFGRNAKVFQFLAENDDSLLGDEGILVWREFG